VCVCVCVCTVDGNQVLCEVIDHACDTQSYDTVDSPSTSVPRGHMGA
jgi:hypothetical protein